MSHQKTVTIYCDAVRGDEGTLCPNHITVLDENEYLSARLRAESSGWRRRDGADLCKHHAKEWWQINRGSKGMQKD